MNSFAYFKLKGKNIRPISLTKKILAISILQLPIIHHIYKPFYKKHISGAVERVYPKLTGVNIEGYNVCNGNCAMCSYPNMTRPKTLMSMDLFRKIVDDLINNGFVSFGLHFFNEPFLDPLIFERIEYLKKKKAKIVIFTNASVLDKEKTIKLLDNPPRSIIISIDAVKPETFKKIRRGLDLEIVRNNIRYLAEQKRKRGIKSPHIQTVYVVSKNNVDEVEDYIKEWTGVVDRVTIHPDHLSTEKLPWLFRYPYACDRAFNRLNIVSDGRAALCCLDSDCQHPIGDFKKQSFQEIYNGEAAKKYRELHKNLEAGKIELCKNCSFCYTEAAYSWWRK